MTPELPKEPETSNDGGDPDPEVTEINVETKRPSMSRRASYMVAPVVDPPKQPLPQIPLWIKDWTATIIVGAFTASHWRGFWTLLDLWTCSQPESATLVSGENFCFLAIFPTDSEITTIRFQSGILSYWLGVMFTILGVGMVWAGFWTPPESANGKVTWQRAIVRWIMAYTLCVACVCQWRGIWYCTDELVWKDYPIQSFWLTTCVGAAAAFVLQSGGGLLAPPAIFLLDGPGLNQPPIAVTIMSSYYSLKLEAGEKPPARGFLPLLLDALVSFFGLPIMVVWFWRGLWALQDVYFWGLTVDRQDVLVSLGWSSLLGLLCAIFASEPVLAFALKPFESNTFMLAFIGRFRTLILAIGCVAFWRVIWSLWDLNGTTFASAWSSEVVSVSCMTAMGCLCSLTAPPSTLGVDVTPNPKCADEPLFAMLPVPWELLTWWGIARQPKVVPVDVSSVFEMSEHSGRRPSLLASIVSGSSVRDSLSFRMSATYFESQRPSIQFEEVWVEGNAFLQQRPSIENHRRRSSFFRDR
jgi:hypothetical protein